MNRICKLVRSSSSLRAIHTQTGVRTCPHTQVYVHVSACCPCTLRTYTRVFSFPCGKVPLLVLYGRVRGFLLTVLSMASRDTGSLNPKPQAQGKRSVETVPGA